MGVTPETNPVPCENLNALNSSTLPSSTRDLSASLAKAGISVTPGNCIGLDNPSFHPARGMGSSSLLAITGASSITLKGNNTATRIEGNGITVGESLPLNPQSWPPLKITSLGDRSTTVTVGLDDCWPLVQPPPHTEHQIGSLNGRASLTAACAPETQSFILQDPKIDRRLASPPTLPIYGTSRGAELDLYLIEHGVDQRTAQPTNGATLAATEFATALLTGKSILVLSAPTTASMGARPGYTPSLWDGANVSLNFPDGAHRILIVGTPLISADPEIKKGISIVVEGNDGTVYTTTRAISGELRIRCADGGLQIEDSIDNGSQIRTYSIMSARLGQDPKIANRGEPQGAAIVEQVAAMLSFGTTAEMRMSSLLRANRDTEGLHGMAQAAPRLFSAADKGLHQGGLSGMGDRTAFAGETASGTRVTLMPTFLAAGSYQVNCEFKSPIRGTELLALTEAGKAGIAGVNQKPYIPGSPLPTEIRHAHLGFNDARAMLRFVRELSARESLG